MMTEGEFAAAMARIHKDIEASAQAAKGREERAAATEARLLEIERHLTKLETGA